MAPKKKGNKRQEEDWEAELGESVPAATETPAEANGDAAANGDDDQMGGGLLAALKKNRSKKAKKGKALDNDFVEGEDPTQADTNGDAAVDLSSKAPQEATFDDEDDVFTGKPKKGKAAPAPPKLEPAEEAEEGGKVKSKKEKEKEKKEREKQRKKEQAAKKKAATPAAPVKEEPVKAAPEVKAEPTPAPAAKIEPAGKKKKIPAHLAAIQKQQEALRKAQEEEERLRAEAEAAEAERIRKLEEEEKKKEEARQRKKEKEREKKEQLRKEGKLLTKAQKEAKERNELRMKQMLAAGVGHVAGLEERGEPSEKKKMVVTNRKKKGPKKDEVDLEAAAAAARAQREAEDEKRRKEEEDLAKAQAAKDEADLEDDWEAAAKAEVGDDVKDSWDAESDEEQQDNKQVDQEQKTAKQANGTAKSEDSESEEETSSDEEDEEATAAQKAIAQRKAEAAERRKKQHEEALAARSKDNLRSPICCILGHVDTGKTKLLDKIRQTNVQEGEAGGITQQIGATYFPVDALKQKTAVVNRDGSFEFKIPGLLIIDTPGHESFSNLRSRGSSLCNIAILVVDIMHGLEPQTLESMRLLRDRKTPFIVALNKIDRLYGWKKIDNNGFQESLAMQSKGVINEFRSRVEQTKLAFAEQGFNSELYWENKSMARNVSLVPTSAHTGEGIPDMLKLLTTLTQERMTNSLMYLSEVECTVLEVKVIEGLGTTIDVVLSNGILREGDRIVLCGLNGPIATNIRALLTPAPLKELRLKSQYVHNKEVKAALGVKIAANDLEHAIAGSRLMVVGPDDDEEDLEEEVMSDLENLLSKVSKDQRGVSVQASTLGSLEALLEFLRVSKIPVSNISIGPVFKRDVMLAGTMLEKGLKEYAVMLCFDVKVDKEAQAYADDVGVKIFTADIIYHLFDDFTKHMAELNEQRKEESKMHAVFPCVLKTVAVFNKKDPIVVGVDVVEGSLRLLTPIAVVKQNAAGQKEIIQLGRVASIERDHKAIQVCKRGQPSVAVKIDGANQPAYGRQLEESDTLYSEISRKSIDTLKEFYRSDVTMEEWALIKKMKPLFDIP
ncbi:mitochondrial translation initiation factor IF-2, putative [Talaromyces stipitatus ATCC 10500]|uniref:Eukaryotic translation initiation factor 5B n=1 Tax=Talaromyces stipitatus (strain ATCC 10500 / CBS 375.48 / QM 6759 / NRRL 1006) TaxID=441959 RepID=B8MFI6_TALSN|nr:mitochondrial translation initiation factor IF-2, putative [Talaromyces stipitatus ATCC 10500]EED16720.1 mitochondrial translation initiation factor IF-2, putative [Talaromyces stipitatus ATCC 10500]